MSVERECWQRVAELELCSQVSAVNLDSSGGKDASESIGGKRPSGGVDHKGDRDRAWVLKSAEHFRRRLQHAEGRDRVLQQILVDATAAVRAHKRQPAPSGEPEYGSSQWKRWVVESPLSSEEIARKYNVKGQYVRRIRAQYVVPSDSGV